MKYCTKCGNQNNSEAEFCMCCGAPLDSVTPVTGNTHNINSVPVCSHCGTQLTTEKIMQISGIQVCSGCGCKVEVSCSPIDDNKKNNGIKSECNLHSENLIITDPEKVYLLARDVMNDDNIEAYKAALADFETIPDYKDSGRLAEICRGKISELSDHIAQDCSEKPQESTVQNKTEKNYISQENANDEKLGFCRHCGAVLTEATVMQHGGNDICLNCGCVTEIPEYFKRRRNLYFDGIKSMQQANSEKTFKIAAKILKSVSGYKDADSLAAQCLENAEICRKDAVYSCAENKMMIGSYEEAISLLKTISGWKDADEQICICQKKTEEIKAKAEAARIEAEKKAEEKRIAAEKRAKKRKKAIIIGTPIACVFIALVIVVFTVIIPTLKYKSAIELFEEEKYTEAAEVFSSLNYKDSEEKAKECFFNIQKNDLKKIYVGKTVRFGVYEQDNDLTNGKEEIEWKILKIKGKKALLVSEYALDCKQYNSTDTDVTWEECTVRSWLNDEFFNEAFGAKHKEKIVSSTISADENPKYNTDPDPGNKTTDNVFLLSIKEAEKYFTTDNARQCKPTEYAVANGAYVNNFNENCWWWLRTPGNNQECASFVQAGGWVHYVGNPIDTDDGCVRPAMWIDVTGAKIQKAPVTEEKKTEPATETEKMHLGDEYKGLWGESLMNDGNTYAHELTITNISDDKVIFDYWEYRIYSGEDIVATIDETGKATFEGGNLKGYLLFDDDEIRMTLTSAPYTDMTEKTRIFKKVATTSRPPVSGVPEDSDQVVYFDTATQNMSLYTYSGTSWEKDMENIHFTYGRNGTTSNKYEGDGCTPTGTFNIGFYYGLNDAGAQLKFKQINSDSVWVDDSNSYYYNTIQSRYDYYSDWNSAEDLYSSYFQDNAFNYCIYFESNGDGLSGGSAKSGKGSLITICGKNTSLTSTAGCVDISGSNMKTLLSYLDSSLNPVVVIE